MTDDKHPCSQEVTLNTICMDIQNIKEDVKEIKEFQAIFMQKLDDSMLRSAKYPDPDFVNKVISKVDRHETYFKIIGIVLSITTPLLVMILFKLW